jgi:glycosyltransferase involved in cell wall biosynthesis
MTHVSVVMPVWNAAQHLDGAIEGVLGQTFHDLELIVVDDGSTDASAKVIEAWTRRSGRVRSISCTTSSGSGAARNRGIAAATGDYVWFADADDYWESQLLQLLVSSAESTGADVVVCGALVCTEDGRLVHRLDAPRRSLVTGMEAVDLLLTGRLQGHTWNKLIRRTILTDRSFPHLSTHQDLSAMFGILSAARTVAFIDDSLYHYVRHAGSSLNNANRVYGSLLQVAQQVLDLHAEGALPGISATHVRYFVYRHAVLEALHDFARLPPSARRAWAPTADAARAFVTREGVGDLMRTRWWSAALECVLATRARTPYILAYRATRRVVHIVRRCSRRQTHQHWN